MTRRTWIYTVAAGLPALGMAANQRLALFNGRDFSGWVKAGHGIWSIEEDALVGRCDHSRPGPGYLFTRREYADFRLGLEFWISPGGNSGVFIREPYRSWGIRNDERPAHGPLAGYELQVDYRDAANPTGSIYGVRKPSRVTGGEQRWNRLDIECNGPRIRVLVDGAEVNSLSPARTLNGAIGLQIHGGRPHHHVVKFRRLELEVLPPWEA